MKEKGWIKLHRNLLENLKWQNLKEQQKTIFITILLLASPTKKAWSYKGEIYRVKPGEFITSRKTLAKYTNLSESSIQRNLKTLEKQGIIEQKTHKTHRKIKIKNMEEYIEPTEQQSEQPITDRAKQLSQCIKPPLIQ